MKDEEKNDKNQEIKAKSNEAGSPDASEEAFRDDEIQEFEFNDDGEEDLKKTLKKLRVDLKVCKKEKEEYLTGWQKERADFINYKKGEEDRKANFSEVVRERILTRFLTAMDSFDMAFANKETWEKVDHNWRRGIEYIYAQMGNIFEEYGVKAIGEVEEKFDPNIHQSIEMISTDKKENEHKIAEVIQKGYKLGDRVLRAARVNVYEYHEPRN